MSDSDNGVEDGLVKGPVLAMIKISPRFVQMYQQGVISHIQCDTSDKKFINAVISGYSRSGVAGSGAFWQVRGSFGKYWGMNGLFRVEKWNESRDGDGPCWVHYAPMGLDAKEY